MGLHGCESPAAAHWARLVQFSTVFPDTAIVAALLRELGWTHFTMLIPIKDPLKREFYAEMCRVERWSTRALRDRLDSMLFERTALSKKPEALVRKELSALREKGELSPSLVFRDPYMRDFLGLADTYSEKDLESAILREIERFSSSSVGASPSSNGRSASRSMGTTTTSICSSSTAACSGSSRSS